MGNLNSEKASSKILRVKLNIHHKMIFSDSNYAPEVGFSFRIGIAGKFTV